MSFIDDVRAFHERYGCQISESPRLLTEKELELRRGLIAEEWYELSRAMVNDDLVGVADGLADLIYVVIGTALSYGIPLEKVWKEVQRSNLSKTGKKDGKGKVTKGSDFVPPDIANIIRISIEKGTNEW